MMKSECHNWTEADHQTLRECWQKGFSAVEIGMRIGVSKNSILGMAHRKKLSPRRTPNNKYYQPRIIPSKPKVPTIINAPRRVKLSAYAIERNICANSKDQKDRTGTVIPWKNPALHSPLLIRVLWDGYRQHNQYHRNFLEDISVDYDTQQREKQKFDRPLFSTDDERIKKLFEGKL